MNCDLGWLRLFVGTGLNHFYGGFNTPGHSTPIYFTSSVLPNSPGYLQLPFFILIGPLITVPSSNARTQCSITLTQHLCVCVGGGSLFLLFCFLLLLFFPSVIWVTNLPRIIQGKNCPRPLFR